MRVSRDGLLLTALICVMWFVSLTAMILADNDLLSEQGVLLLEFFIIAAGVGLWKLLDRKRRREAAEEIAASERTPQRWDGCVPEPCQLCYGNAAQVRCQPHELLICLPCCTNHDPRHQCTMYLLPRYAEAQKARA